MTEYRRFYISKASWFFSVNLAERKNNRLSIEQIDVLSQAFRYIKIRKPFYINAVVIMPDHLHSTAWMQEVEQCMEQLPSIWTLPTDDGDYSTRWNLLKGYFSRKISPGERFPKVVKNGASAAFTQRAQVATTVLGAFNQRPRRFKSSY